jgi:alpha-L-fucosidase 2
MKSTKENKVSSFLENSFSIIRRAADMPYRDSNIVLSAFVLSITFFFSFLICQAQERPSKYNITWTTPSDGSFGSMPLGNGDIGMNVWTEKNGDILFYISKVNAYNSDHLLPKLGKVRITFSPALDVSNFRQILQLEDGSIRIIGADLNVKVIVCANQPMISITGSSKEPRKVYVSLEPLRELVPEGDITQNVGTAGILFNTPKNRLAWCYRNLSSEWAKHFASQNTPAMVAKTKGPILLRTSGCLIEGAGLVRTADQKMSTLKKQRTFAITVKVLSSQPQSVREWLAQISNQEKPDFRAHNAYWHQFWQRSYIDINSCGKGKIHLDQCRFTQIPQGSIAYQGHNTIDADSNAFQISQRYALERFCEAIASRGEVPPPYNGSIFTMDMPVGVKKFSRVTEEPKSPDKRDWARLSFMWQNTRHPYWSMSARGDFDCMLSCTDFVRNSLEISKDRCEKTFGVKGAFIPEASWWHNVGVFNWNQVPQHLHYHQLATIETAAIMCDYYENTRDVSFLNKTLLPWAAEAIKYYANRFTERDANGKMVMPNVGCVETYQHVTNPCTEIGGLKFVLSRLLTFKGGSLFSENESYWKNLLVAMPAVPMRKIRGQQLLAVGDVYAPGRQLCESPELYSVYPFRQAWLGTPELLSVARQSFHVRTVSIDGSNDGEAVETGGWQSAPVQAACLGLAREAARLTSINFNDQFINWKDDIAPDTAWSHRPRPRFPVFWECKMDGTPDNDHGANSESALQNMLLQSDGDKIYLLPAWPEDWDVSFKLYANNLTTVECSYKDGKVQKLIVKPESRARDIVDMTTEQQRIRTLTEVALCDYNYLFSLPQMLDGIPVAGKTTKSWLDRYGYTIMGCKAGPWKQSLFHDNVAYIHVFDWPKEGILLPNIDRELISSESVTGNIKVTKTSEGWLLKGAPDSVHTIVKLAFDKTLQPIAEQIPSNGSYCTKDNFSESRDSTMMLVREVTFGKERAINRFEFSIDNTVHKRGEGRTYRVETKNDDGTWRTVYDGKVYGIICSKAIPEMTCKSARLVVNAESIRQFDLFDDK